MLLPTLIGVVGLLSTVVEAVPKGTEFNNVREVPHHARGSRAFRERVAARADSDNSYGPRNAYPHPNYYNLTTPTSFHHNTESSMLFADTDVAIVGCPTASLLVWTTTIDTTIFVTATSNFTHTEEPGRDDSTTAHDAGLSFLLSSATTECDDETAPVYPGPKTVTVENHDSTETEPCTDNPWFAINSTITHSPPIYVTPVGAQSTDAEEPGTLTTDCDDETATNGSPAVYTPPSGNFSTPHTPVESTEPCDDETLSATLTSDPTVLTPIPYGNFNTPYTKPAESTESRDDEAVPATSPSDSPAIYTSLPFGNASTPYATPPASTEPCDDETSSVSGSPASFTPLPYGNFTPPYATPAGSTEPCEDETTAAASASDAPIFTPLPSGNFSTPNTGLVESTTSSTISSDVTFTTPCDESTISWFNSPIPGNATATPSFSTKPFDETSTSGTVDVTPFLSTTTTPLATPTSEGHVIDTSTTPVSTPGLNTNSTHLRFSQDGRRRAARGLVRHDLWSAQ